MAYEVSKMDVWVGEIQDKPGALAEVLAALADAGVDLESLLARRQPDKPGTGVVFASPIKGAKAVKAAQAVGLHRPENLAALKVSGTNKAGVGAQLTKAVGDAGINLRGVQAAAIGDKFVAYLAFDSTADASKALRALKALDAPKKKGK